MFLIRNSKTNIADKIEESTDLRIKKQEKKRKKLWMYWRLIHLMLSGMTVMKSIKKSV